jgi:hypothetical protein
VSTRDRETLERTDAEVIGTSPVERTDALEDAEPDE